MHRNFGLLTVICVPLAANYLKSSEDKALTYKRKITYCNMLSGAFPTLSNLALRTGSAPPNSESLNWEIISLLAFKCNNYLEPAILSNNPLRTNGEDTDNAINSNTDYPFSGFSGTRYYLDANIDRCLLTKTNDLRS